MNENKQDAKAVLADRLEDFRKRHWMHWVDSRDNALVCEVVATLASAPPAAEVEKVGEAWVRDWADYWRKRALSAESAQGPAVKCGQCGNTEVFFYARPDELRTAATTGATPPAEPAQADGGERLNLLLSDFARACVYGSHEQRIATANNIRALLAAGAGV